MKDVENGSIKDRYRMKHYSARAAHFVQNAARETAAFFCSELSGLEREAEIVSQANAIFTFGTANRQKRPRAKVGGKKAAQGRLKN